MQVSGASGACGWGHIQRGARARRDTQELLTALQQLVTACRIRFLAPARPFYAPPPELERRECPSTNETDGGNAKALGSRRPAAGHVGQVAHGRAVPGAGGGSGTHSGPSPPPAQLPACSLPPSPPLRSGAAAAMDGGESSQRVRAVSGALRALFQQVASGGARRHRPTTPAISSPSPARRRQRAPSDLPAPQVRQGAALQDARECAKLAAAAVAARRHPVAAVGERSPPRRCRHGQLKRGPCCTSHCSP